MKMSKVLAAGIAATLAVSSLATVASADTLPIERDFPMEYTYGRWTYEPVITKGGKTEQLGKDFAFVKPNEGKIADNYGVKNLNDVNVDTNFDGATDYQDYDGFIPLTVASATGVPLQAMGDLTVIVEGKKYDNGNLVPRTQKIILKAINGATLDGVVRNDVNYVLPIYTKGSPVDEFLPEEFAMVDKISVNAASLKKITLIDMDYSAYRYVAKNLYDGVAKSALRLSYTPGYTEPVNVHSAEWYKNENAWGAAESVDVDGQEDAKLTITLAAADYLNTQLCYQATAANRVAKTITGTAVAYNNDGGHVGDNKQVGADLIREINTLLKDGIEARWEPADAGETDVSQAWMGITTTSKEIMYRSDIRLLSNTEDYNSLNIWDSANPTDYNQTYDWKKDTAGSYKFGTGAEGFAGLASHVADFFNGQTNGKIIFNIVAETDQAGFTLDWKKGGIPSTEVGIRNWLEQKGDVTKFALFFNYAATTGSLQADAVEFNKKNATIEIDITPVLEKLGGHTIGVIQDIYYGLNDGVAYDAWNIGFKIKSVTLQYEKGGKANADADAATDDEKKEEAKPDDKADETEIEIKDEDDDTTEPEIPDDDDSTVIIDDTDDTTGTEVDNTGDNTVVVNPGNNTAPAADENPHTGVALAVVPAALAAAAMLISKKRK